MFPLSAEKLSLLEIAEFWSREIKPPASKKELLARLEAAWWLGEITGNSAITRLQFLKKMFESRQEPHLQSVVFVTPNDAGPLTETPLEGGEVVVDVRPRISVPGHANNWTESSCADAFETLANSPSLEHFPELSVGLCFIELAPKEFQGWLINHGFDVPKFWKRIAEIDITQATPQDRGTSNDLETTPVVHSGGRGAQRRAVQMAYKTLFPKLEIPPGMTSQRRNDSILAMLKDAGHKPLPDKRTIERAIKDLKL